ncbi:MarR family winged helix-turn-helix transcriptional regulator [Streptococcus hongkongensis]
MKLKKMSKELVKSFDSYISNYELYARQHGLQGKSLQILLWIYHNPQGVTQKYLCHKTFSTKQVINATIKNWMQKGYVTMQSRNEDKRQRLIFLTEDGHSFAKKIIQPLEECELHAIGSLDEKERELLITLMEKYTATVIKEMENL